METIRETMQKAGVSQPPLSELYKDIELTEEEKAAAIERGLFEARYEKAAAMNKRNYTAKVLTEVAPVRYTKDQLKGFLLDLKGFCIDSDNELIVDLLCYYFSEDSAFEQFTDPNGKAYSLRKGILLFGGVGVGKTMLMELFKNNQKGSYQVVTCQDVESTYAKNGPDYHPQNGAPGLRKFFGLASLPAKNQYGHNTMGYLFDDLGQERKKTLFFGTERNVMEEVITQRYKNNLFEETHITTNESADQIEASYGIRVRDRMREMFNFIPFEKTAKSRRV